MKITGQTFTRDVVPLDGNEFCDCVFDECRVRYAGTGTVTLNNTSMQNCQFEFTGAASNTVKMLSVMCQSPEGRMAVETLLGLAQSSGGHAEVVH